MLWKIDLSCEAEQRDENESVFGCLQWESICAEINERSTFASDASHSHLCHEDKEAYFQQLCETDKLTVTELIDSFGPPNVTLTSPRSPPDAKEIARCVDNMENDFTVLAKRPTNLEQACQHVHDLPTTEVQCKSRPRP